MRRTDQPNAEESKPTGQAKRPAKLTMKEWLDMVSNKKLITMKRSGADIIREIRDSRP